MNGDAADNSEPGALASMLEAAWPDGRLWGERELAAVLRHQLAAPLHFDRGETRDTPAAATPGISTFQDLLHHAAPPVELLSLAKDFAKATRQEPDAALPKEIAAVLYFASIVVARRRCGRTITGLSPEDLRAGVDWVLAQAWVDPATRT